VWCVVVVGLEDTVLVELEVGLDHVLLVELGGGVPHVLVMLQKAVPPACWSAEKSTSPWSSISCS
jgi:hypothetical protein